MGVTRRGCYFPKEQPLFKGVQDVLTNERQKCLCDIEAARMGLWHMLMGQKQMHLAHHILIDAYRLQIMLQSMPHDLAQCQAEEWVPFESQRNNLIGTIAAIRVLFMKDRAMNKMCSRLDQVIGFLKAFKRDRPDPSYFLIHDDHRPHGK